MLVKRRLAVLVLLFVLACMPTCRAKAQCMATVTPSEPIPGESVPTVALRMEGYEYVSVRRLLADIRAAGEPGSVDIRPAYIPLEELYRVREALPETDVFCATGVLGVEAQTTDRYIDLSKRKVEDIDKLLERLDCFPWLEKVDLSDCGLTNEQMESVCAARPDIRFVWRVHFGSWSLRTDATAFSTLNSNTSPHFTSEDFSVLRYCADLRALDLGHNSITDLRWIEGLTQLRILILADNEIADITPLSKLVNLEYVELFMNEITDVSPLSGLTKLLDLNLCHNHIADGSPLYGLSNLERLWFSYNRELPEEETVLLQEALPDCLCNFTIYYSTHAGWRGHDRYFVLKEIFAKGDFLEWDAVVPREK